MKKSSSNKYIFDMESVEIEKFPPMQNWIMMLFDHRLVNMKQKNKIFLFSIGFRTEKIAEKLFRIQIGKMLHMR